jgi:hypothetical protein
MEIDYFEALGVTAPEETPPADETETGGVEASGNDADDSAENNNDGQESDDIGENEQETAEPAEPEDNEDKSKQSKEERSRNAAARRKAELDAAIEKARQEERDKALNDFLAEAGLTNPLDDDKPIKTIEDYRAYKAAYEADKLSKNLKSGKLTPEDLAKAVAETEPVKKLARLAEETERLKAEAKIQDELKQIHALDPSVSTVEDILKMDTSKEFYAYVQKGNSFIDAFYLANREKLSNKSQEIAKQKALTSARSKDHLAPHTKQRGQGSVPVPPDEMANFRVFMPNATDAEIQAYYNKYVKNQKG